MSHGLLEGLLQEPENPSFAAVACHPHPLYGGTMNNNVIYRVARGLYDAGGAVLRFNFRGVGRSTGAYANAIGEQEDAIAALDFLSARQPSLPLWMAGFSFGARVGLDVGARDPRVVRLLGVGLALTVFDLSFLYPVTKPKAFIQGEADEFGAGPQVEELVARMAEPKRLEIVSGASHLFPGKLPELEQAIGRGVAFLQDAR
ncbi:MAG: alpha/beta hydrolase [Deltaproteobacteria bacterium]|nr:alpha/beta hydrolase [Deltaproteobacteria bacterium]